MFLSLIGKAIEHSWKNKKFGKIDVSIVVYNAEVEDYPETEDEWDYDGILIPGSFSSAHEEEEWITSLKNVIQQQIHEKERKTMAVCFGHQIFAHSFRANENEDGSTQGLAAPCPSGMQVGRKSFKSVFPLSNDLSMLYTHGDMVKRLPSCATSMGGTEVVPIQAACYFSSTNHTIPHAFTFQGHPEFSTDLGISTFYNIVSHFDKKCILPTRELEIAKRDAEKAFLDIQKDSVLAMQAVADTFGWI